MNQSSPETVARRVRRLKIIGVIVLLLGIAGAGVVCWLGTREPDVSNDASMLRFYRAESREMGRLHGKQGMLVDELSNDLKRPGVQAVIIVVFSGLVAAGFFIFAGLPPHDHDDLFRRSGPPDGKR